MVARKLPKKSIQHSALSIQPLDPVITKYDVILTRVSGEGSCAYYPDLNRLNAEC